MSPFDLFFASIGTCVGFYALRFCQERNIRVRATLNLKAKTGLAAEWNKDKYRETLRSAISTLIDMGFTSSEHHSLRSAK